MKIKEMIEKWRLELAEKPDGTEGIRPGKKLTINQVDQVKAKKAEIMEELKAQKAARQAHWAKMDAERAKREAEYMAIADLRRYLVVRQDEYLNTTYSIQTLDFSDGKAYNPEFGGVDYVEIAHVTPAMKSVKKKDWVRYGMECVAWEITAEQEAQIVAEQKNAQEAAREEARKEAEAKEAKRAEKQAEKEADLARKFAEAKEIGKPVKIESATVNCDGSVVECSVDILTMYAMPDGSTKTERIHAH